MIQGARFKFAFSHETEVGVVPKGAIAIVEECRVEFPRMEVGFLGLQIFFDGERQLEAHATFREEKGSETTVNPYDPTYVRLHGLHLEGLCLDAL